MHAAARVFPAVLFAFAITAQEVAPPKYSCDGFAAPLNRGSMEVERGRVLPLKGKLSRADGTAVVQGSVRTAPVVHIALSGEDKSGVLEAHDYGKGRSFVFDPEAHWKFDLGTSTLTGDGTWVVTLMSGDPKEYVVDPACRLEFSFR
jgi:hypothetical protein